MPRGHAAQSKVHYQGKDDDFIIFVDSAQDVENWKKDKSIPMAQVINGFHIFVTHKHGAQGVHDKASNSTLENEFGTSKIDDCLPIILEKGTVQETESTERQGSKNDSMGTRGSK